MACFNDERAIPQNNPVEPSAEQSWELSVTKMIIHHKIYLGEIQGVFVDFCFMLSKFLSCF